MNSFNFAKYEEILFYLFKNSWCIWITVTSYFNFIRINNKLQQYQNIESGFQSIAIHNYYDEKVKFIIKCMIMCFIIDLIIFSIKRNLATKIIIFHHVFGIILCLSVLTSDYPHHYCASLIMCSEVVSCFSIIFYFAKIFKSELLRKFYLAQYLFLTVFVRGSIWLKILFDLVTSNHKVNIICYLCLIPLICMDYIWSKQCIRGLMK
jgi:hypothetical protein